LFSLLATANADLVNLANTKAEAVQQRKLAVSMGIHSFIHFRFSHVQLSLRLGWRQSAREKRSCLIGNTENLSRVEKFQHIHAYVVKAAIRTIKSFEPTQNNYDNLILISGYIFTVMRGRPFCCQLSKMVL